MQGFSIEFKRAGYLWEPLINKKYFYVAKNTHNIWYN